MAERDNILSHLPKCPEPTDCHVDIAVLEAWADGVIDDEYLTNEVAKCHTELKECSQCAESVSHYKARRLHQLSIRNSG